MLVANNILHTQILYRLVYAHNNNTIKHKMSPKLSKSIRDYIQNYESD